MFDLLESPFPLERITYVDLQNLTKALWNWEICNACKSSLTCVTPSCSWKRSGRLGHFFEFYKEVTSSYVPELLPGSPPALRNHQDLLNIIELLQSNPGQTRSTLTSQHFSRCQKLPPAADQHRAFNLAIRVLLMISCSAQSQPSGLLELGTQPLQWQADVTLVDFITRSFPPASTDGIYHRNKTTLLTARRLKKIAGLKFQGTDDLRNHLRLDSKQGVVEIFHYTSMLKEHLAASKSDSGEESMAKSTKVVILPRQIALEVLSSIQMVLFPFDSDSEPILRSLVSKDSFDPGCLRYDSAAHRKEDERDVPYIYFGSRLADLYEELNEPSPHSFFEKWMERRSGARYVMMATLAGVMIAVLLGILGLAVGIFQAWVAYEAWKHPVSSGN